MSCINVPDLAARNLERVRVSWTPLRVFANPRLIAEGPGGEIQQINPTTFHKGHRDL